MKIGIFYGSTTGVTEAVAERIAKKLGVASADVHNVGSATAADAVGYDALLLGSSTWGAGELQDDWYDFLDQLKSQDLTGKKVALFGCGDSSSFSDTFCSAMGEIHDGLAATGCTFVRSMPPAIPTMIRRQRAAASLSVWHSTKSTKTTRPTDASTPGSHS